MGKDHHVEVEGDQQQTWFVKWEKWGHITIGHCVFHLTVTAFMFFPSAVPRGGLEMQAVF